MIVKTNQCSTCLECLKDKGDEVYTLYNLICQYYTAYAAVCLELKDEGSLENFLQILEECGYVTTSEANHPSMIIVRPNGHAIFDDEGCTTIYCADPSRH